MLTEIAGWLDPKVAAAMRQLILEQKPEVIVEIGVFAGKSLINSALALKENGKGVIYGIDPWRNRDAVAAVSPNDNPQFWASVNLDDIHTACMHAIWEHELEEHVIIIRATSELAYRMIRRLDCGIYILYIDGGHSEEVSSRDAELYLKDVWKNGYIWIDDADWPSLQKALSMLREHCDLVQDFGHCHLYKKR